MDFTNISFYYLKLIILIVKRNLYWHSKIDKLIHFEELDKYIFMLLVIVNIYKILQCIYQSHAMYKIKLSDPHIFYLK